MGGGLPLGLSTVYWRTFEISRSAGSLSETLTGNEEWIGSWDGVGLYQGNVNKVPNYQDIIVHLTTHRLILLNPTNVSATSPSLQTSLSYIRQTEFYNGFMRSAPKITLFLGRTINHDSGNGAISTASSKPLSTTGSWTCGVCGYVNPLSSFETGDRVNEGTKCSLCGVGYSNSRSQGSVILPNETKSQILEGGNKISQGITEIDGLDSDGIPCPACTFLNHRYLTSCEICSTPLPNNRSSLGIGGGAEEDIGKFDIVRLSFRKGGVQEAYKKLKSVLGDKVWERNDGSLRRGHRSNVSGGVSDEIDGTVIPRAGIGIDGILQSINLDAKAQDETMQDAFKDLEVLMVRAGEMVRLAQSLNAKLIAQQANAGPNSTGVTEQEKSLIQTSLVQLGLAAPALTQDMVKNAKEYHDGLAKELGTLLTGRKVFNGSKSEGLMVGIGSRGVIGLDEVWGLWMRARGVALLPPSTLISVIPFLSLYTNPQITLLNLPSSLKVLHTPHYSPENILNRLSNLLTPNIDLSVDDGDSNTSDGVYRKTVEPCLSIVEIAAYEGLAVGLAKELVESVEEIVGGIVRDEQAGQEFGGVRWYRDLISGWSLSLDS